MVEAEDYYAVDLGVSQEYLCGLFVHPRVHDASEVDGIVVGGEGRDLPLFLQVLESLDSIIGEPVHPEAQGNALVYSHDARPSSVRDHPYVISSCGGLQGQRLPHVEEPLHVPSPQDADLFEQAVVYPVCTGYRSGVGEGRPRPRLRLPRLQTDHRLVFSDLHRDINELPPCADPLHVQEDDSGPLVVQEVEQHLWLCDIHLVPEAHQLAQPHLVPGEVVDGGGAEGAALGHYGYVPGGGAGGRYDHIASAQGLGLREEEHVHA